MREQEILLRRSASKLTSSSRTIVTARTNALQERSLSPDMEQQVTDNREIGWLQTFVAIEPKDRISKGLKYVCIADGLSSTQLYEKTGLDEDNLNRIMRGLKMPYQNTLNKLIEVSTLDNYGKPAQLLRLEAGGLKPLSMEEIQKNSFGAIFEHLRVMKGETKQETADKFFVSNSTSTLWSNDKRLPVLKEELLLEWLGLSEKNPLSQIMLKKLRKEEVLVQERDYQELVQSKYLFAEHIEHIGPYSLSSKETDLYNDIQQMKASLQSEGSQNIVGQILRHIRTANNLKQRDVLQDDSHYSRFERGVNLPSKHKIGTVGYGLGYPLPHPIGIFLVDLTAEEEIKRGSRAKETARKRSLLDTTELSQWEVQPHNKEIIVFDTTLSLTEVPSQDWLKAVGEKEGITMRLNSVGISYTKLAERLGFSSRRFAKTLLGEGSIEDIKKLRAIVDNL